MKKLMSIALIPLLGCIGVSAGFAEEKKLRVAVVLPGPIDDMAWSQSLYDGVKAVQQKLGEDKMAVDVSERLWKPVDADSAARQYALQGYDMIIAHSAKYQSFINELAVEFPNITFMYGTGVTNEHPNVFSYAIHAEEGAYLLGMLAGYTTKTNIIGIVGPMEVGDAVKYNNGFIQGVKAVNPEADIRIAYTGSFEDVIGAGEIAKTHINAGADLLTGSGEQAVGAINVTKKRGNVFWCSTDLDQSILSPETVLAAQVYDFKKIIETVIEKRKNGILGGEHLDLSFANGSLSLCYNDALASEIPAEVKAKIEDAKANIIDGSLKIGLE